MLGYFGNIWRNKYMTVESKIRTRHPLPKQTRRNQEPPTRKLRTIKGLMFHDRVSNHSVREDNAAVAKEIMSIE